LSAADGEAEVGVGGPSEFHHDGGGDGLEGTFVVAVKEGATHEFHVFTGGGERGEELDGASAPCGFTVVGSIGLTFDGKVIWESNGFDRNDVGTVGGEVEFEELHSCVSGELEGGGPPKDGAELGGDVVGGGTDTSSCAGDFEDVGVGEGEAGYFTAGGWDERGEPTG
jgi:hypothetical protein